MATATLPPPTDRQRQMLDFIRSEIAEKGYPPTVREIGKAMGIVSPNGVLCHVRALEKKGHLTRAWNTSRSFRLIEGAEPSAAARLLRTLADRATRLPRGHDRIPCTHAIYLMPDELAAIERHAAPGEAN